MQVKLSWNPQLSKVR